jgi:hypothetical protein
VSEVRLVRPEPLLDLAAHLLNPCYTLFLTTYIPALLQVRFFVLDEADRLIDHLDEVMSLFKRIPKAGVGIDRLQVSDGSLPNAPCKCNFNAGCSTRPPETESCV